MESRLCRQKDADPTHAFPGVIGTMFQSLDKYKLVTLQQRVREAITKVVACIHMQQLQVAVHVGVMSWG